MLPGCLFASALAWAATAAGSSSFHGAAYRENVLQPHEFKLLQIEANKVKTQMKREKNSIATKRLGLRLDKRSHATRALLQSPRVQNMVADITRQKIQPLDYPIELRNYPIGSSMNWHQDDLLTQPPQLECIFTLENTSDSFTEWRHSDGTTESIWTLPNSLLIMLAGPLGPIHRVTTVRRGERSILKFALVNECVTKQEGFEEHINSFPVARDKRR